MNSSAPPVVQLALGFVLSALGALWWRGRRAYSSLVRGTARGAGFQSGALGERIVHISVAVIGPVFLISAGVALTVAGVIGLVR
jgi:hypothetical protein